MKMVQECIAPGMYNYRPETAAEMRTRVAQERRALSPCPHFGDPTGDSADCKPCTAKHGRPTRQLLYACALFGRCTPQMPSLGVACCATCPHNPQRSGKTVNMSLTPVNMSLTQSVIQIPKQFRKANAFNPSIIDWQGRLLIAYRDSQHAGSKIWIGELDPRTLQLRGAPARLKLDHVKAPQGYEDPRFFVWRGRLHLSFAGVQPSKGQALVHVLFARLTDALAVERVWEPAYAGRTPIEKNWVQFEWQGELFSVYHPGQQHRILHHSDGVCRVFAESPSRLTAEAKGGATPVLVEDEYYHWYHTSRRVGTFFEYTMGLYTFDAKPPFAPKRHIPGAVYVPTHKDRPKGFNKSVVFPGGAVLRGDTWLVSAGYHDTECRILAFDQSEIERAMVNV